MNIKKIIFAYSRHGMIGFFNVLLGKIGFRYRLRTPIDRVIFQLAKHIEKLSNNKIQSGPYKDTHMQINKEWSMHDTSSKLLGLYEKEVQDEIINIQNSKYKKRFFVNIGAGEGYHLTGALKTKVFEYGIGYEIDKSAKKLLKDNMNNNNIDEYHLFDKAEKNFLENKIFKEKNLNDCLFLIDIEGDEFEILNNDNLKRLENSVLIVEIHDFIKSPDKLIKDLSDKFITKKLTTGNRDLSKIKIVEIFHDYEKWLMVQEGRPRKMEWIVCIPKN